MNTDSNELCRTHNFFLKSTNFRKFKDDISDMEIKVQDLNAIDLECSGKSSFYQDEVAKRFVQYLIDAVEAINVKKIRIKITGFDLSICKHMIKSICKIINTKLANLITLQIKTSHLLNCQMQSDFKQLLTLGFSNSATSLQNLALQFASWCFGAPINDDYANQPTLNDLIKTIQDSINDGTMQQGLNSIKKFRLQMSTWYYRQLEYRNFVGAIQSTKFQGKVLNGKKIESPQRYFHYQMARLVGHIIKQVMPALTKLQFDFRNWYSKFEMKTLQQQLMNIKNEGKVSSNSVVKKKSTNNLSMINKALGQSKMLKKSMIHVSNNVPKEQEQQEFDMNVVV